MVDDGKVSNKTAAGIAQGAQDRQISDQDVLRSVISGTNAIKKALDDLRRISVVTKARGAAPAEMVYQFAKALTDYSA
ncbi:hypothetical protein, partial [Streptococcus pneumoniae]